MITDISYHDGHGSICAYTHKGEDFILGFEAPGKASCVIGHPDDFLMMAQMIVRYHSKFWKISRWIKGHYDEYIHGIKVLRTQ